jgi:hypothetical protein
VAFDWEMSQRVIDTNLQSKSAGLASRLELTLHPLNDLLRNLVPEEAKKNIDLSLLIVGVLASELVSVDLVEKLLTEVFKFSFVFLG